MKLISVYNQLAFDLTLTSNETLSDGRPLPMGSTLVLGGGNQGIDVPQFSTDDCKYLTIRSRGHDWEKHFVAKDGYLCTYEPSSKVTSRITIDKKDDNVLLVITHQSTLACMGKAVMPDLTMPRLQGVWNALPSSLQLVNRETASDSVARLESNQWTSTPGQYSEGIDIPEYTGNNWDTRHIEVVSPGGLTRINLYRQGYDIYASFGSAAPRSHKPIAGGASQATGPKCLQVLSTDEVRLVDAPRDVLKSGAWPKAHEGRSVVHAEVDLLRDDEAPVHGPESFQFVARINFPGVDLSSGKTRITLSANYLFQATVDGKPVRVPKREERHIDVTPRPNFPTLIIKTRATSLAAPVLFIQVEFEDGTKSHEVEVFLGERVRARLVAAKLNNDEQWQKARTLRGAKVLPGGTSIPAGASEALHQMLTSVATGKERASANACFNAAGGRDTHGNRASLDRLPDGGCIAFDCSAVTPCVMQGESARAHHRACLDKARAHVNTGLVHSAQLGRDTTGHEWSFHEWLREAWDTITSFIAQVVDGVMRFTFFIADTVLELAVELIGDVFEGIGWVLKRVFGLSMDKLAEWLGTLLDWNAIRETTIELQGQSQNLSQAMANGFTQARDSLQSLRSKVEEAAGFSISAAGLQDFASSPLQQSRAPLGHDYGGMPAVTWGADHLTSNAAADVNVVVPAPGQAMDRVLADIHGTLESIQKTVANALTFDPKQFATMSLGDVLTRALALGADIFLQVLDAVLKVAADLALNFEQILSTWLDAPAYEIPFVSSMYRQVMSKPPGAPITTRELVCFLVAVPATVIGYLASDVEDNSKRNPGGLPIRVNALAATAVPNQFDETKRHKLFNLGMVVGSCQLISGVLNGAIEALTWADATIKINKGPKRPADEASLNREGKALLGGIKLVVDSLGFSCSMATTVLSVKSPPTTRQSIDVALAAYQVVFRFKDAFKLYNYNSKTPAPALLAGGFETIAGYAALPFIALTVVLQVAEVNNGTKPVSTIPVVACRGAQMLSSGVAQILTAYKEVLLATAVADPDPETREAVHLAAGAVMLGRSALLLAVPAATFARVTLNYKHYRHGVIMG